MKSDLFILFKYTSRSRPNEFKRGMESILDNLANRKNCGILVTLDVDDVEYQTYLNYLFGLNYEGEKIALYLISGRSESKVYAINRDMRLLDATTLNNWDILVNMSDDMVFTKKGFDDIIRESCEDKKEGHLLHFPDGKTPIVTLAIMDRAFYDRFGYIYNPEYKSLFCDNEQTDVAKRIGAYKLVAEDIFTHMHPAHGLAKMDAQYQHTESFFQHDKGVYESRKARNFDL